ncbi:hypothetical protein V8E54_009463 [Elaphomyces granulatus]
MKTKDMARLKRRGYKLGQGRQEEQETRRDTRLKSSFQKERSSKVSQRGMPCISKKPTTARNLDHVYICGVATCRHNIHNVNIWVQASTQRYNDFMTAIGRAIPLDNDTRWNSWYYTEINVALLKRRELKVWIDDHWSELGVDALFREDWQELDDIRDFLQPFVDCTLGTQGYLATLDWAFESMELIISHFEKMKIKYRNNPQMLTRIMTGWFKFDITRSAITRQFTPLPYYFIPSCEGLI